MIMASILDSVVMGEGVKVYL